MQKQDSKVTFALIGQPNVGKSSLFTRLTGVGVISSNYPGTTVEFDEGVVTRNGTTVHVRDLPGTFGLSGNTDDENVVLDELCSDNDDSIVMIADSTNLESSLILCFEALELGVPTIIALTKMDESRKRFDIDIGKMEGLLGVPVIPVSSKTSEGVDMLADAACAGLAKIPDFKIEYDEFVETAIKALSAEIDDRSFWNRATAIKVLENCTQFTNRVDIEMRHSANMLRNLYENNYGHPITVSIAMSRYEKAKEIADACVRKKDVPLTRAEKISDLTITPKTGVPILGAICLAIFLTIVYVGSALDTAVGWAYDTFVGTALIDFGASFGEFWQAVLTGIDGSLRAILSLVIPYIMVFYIILGLLEDSGYLTRAVVLMDRVMHHFGLHGGAFIPIIVGLGCNVPAIMAVRTVQSRREKIILSSMIVMSVPCSAQIAIIMGATGNHAGILYALAIFALLVGIAVLTGIVLNKVLKKQPSSLAMELPELVMPSAKNVLFKMWYRVKDFFYIAFPLLVIGSIIIEILLVYGLLDAVIDPMTPVTVGFLGLPAATVVAFLVGILRKEMAVGMLTILTTSAGVPLLDVMTPEQFIVFGVVMAIYMPCIATLATMWKEIGWKETIAVSVMSVTVAVLCGGTANFLLTAL